MIRDKDWPKKGTRVRVVEVGSSPNPELGEIELPFDKSAEFVLPADARFHGWPGWWRLPFKLAGKHEMFVWSGPVKVEVLTSPAPSRRSVKIMFCFPDGTVRLPDEAELCRLALLVCDVFDTAAGPVPIGDGRGAGVRAATSVLTEIPESVLKSWGG